MKCLLKHCWRAFRWLLLLVVIAVVVAAQYFYMRVDEEIRVRTEGLLAKLCPQLTVQVRSARLVEGEGIEIRGISCWMGTSKGRDKCLFLDEVFLSCNTDLRELVKGLPVIQKVVVRRPEVRVTRLADGTWDLAALARPQSKSPSNKPLPEIIIEGAVLEIRDAQREHPQTYTLRDGAIHLTPVAHQFAADAPPTSGFSVKASLRGDYLRWVECTGTAWLSGQATGKLLVDGLEVCPELFAALPDVLFEKVPLPRSEWPELRGTVGAEVDFAIDPAQAQPVQFSAVASLSRATLSDARLPLPLRDLDVRVQCHNGGVTIDSLSARQGNAKIQMAGQMWGWKWGSPLQVTGSLENWVVDNRLVDLMPEKMLSYWKEYDPALRVDVRMAVTYDGEKWLPDIQAQLHDVSFCYAKFPYRVERGRGQVQWKHGWLTTNLLVFAGTQPLDIEARIQNPGPEAQASVTIRGQQLLFDQQLSLAMPPRVCQVVQSLHPSGSFDLDLDIQRRPGLGQPTVMHAVAKVRTGSIRYDLFPYPVTQITGIIDGDGIAYPANHPQGPGAKWRWSFRDIVGRNDAGEIRCHGTVDPADEGGQLRLHVAGTEVAIEQELRDALPERLRPVWNQIRPQGSMNLRAEITHIPGGKPVIEVQIDPLGASIEPVHFPYRIEKLTGQIYYETGLVRMENLAGEHGAVKIASRGECKIDDEGRWRLRMFELVAERLRLDRDSRDRDLNIALPKQLRQALEPLELSGMVNLGGEIELAGSPLPNEPMQAAWDLGIDCQRVGLRNPVVLSNIYGALRVQGAFDGESTFSQGDVDFDSVDFQQLQFTQVRGPFWIDSGQIIFGTLEGLKPKKTRAPLPEGQRHLSGKLVGGTVVADAQVVLGEVPTYHLRCTLVDADLGRYARECIPGKQDQLTGRVMANVELFGAGAGTHTWQGTGQIAVREANFYEVPLFASLRRILNSGQGDDSLFSEGDIEFRIDGPYFHFNQLNFRGQALSLRGSGSMNLNHDIALEFYTVVGRDRVRLPVIDRMLGQASQQLLLIRVDGTLSDPKTRRELVPVVSEALQDLMRELQGGDPAAGTASASSIAPPTQVRPLVK